MERKYVGAAPDARAALHTNCSESETQNTLLLLYYQYCLKCNSPLGGSGLQSNFGPVLVAIDSTTF